MRDLTLPSLLAVLSASVSFGCQASATPATASETVVVAPDWRSQSIYRGDSGVWYTRIAPVVDQFASNEVIAADDKGRFLVLSVYSGNWTVHECTCDRQWVAPSRPADVDPNVPGDELYAGGQAGSIHQVTLRRQPFARFTLESRELAHLAGEEFHTVLAADIFEGPGDELLAFAVTGPIYMLRPHNDGAELATMLVGNTNGRVRDAVATTLPGTTGTTVLAVSRRGDLLALHQRDTKLAMRTVLHEDQGLGRITAAADRDGVFYVTRDDGVLLRVAFDAYGAAVREPILVTDQGLRGVAAGRYFADGREAVAVYGYNGKVQVVSRVGDGAWQVEDIYVGIQKGHWLSAGELDGRNTTDELVAAGFDGEIVLLSRPRGFGLDGAAVSPDDQGR